MFLDHKKVNKKKIRGKSIKKSFKSVVSFQNLKYNIKKRQNKAEIYWVMIKIILNKNLKKKCFWKQKLVKKKLRERETNWRTNENMHAWIVRPRICFAWKTT